MALWEHIPEDSNIYAMVRQTCSIPAQPTGTDSVAVSADDNVVKHSPSADNGKISEKPTTKRLVCMLNRLPSRLLVMSWWCRR